MRDGRIEQIGTPDEIYNHPKTSYVATFVGNANILTGIVESIAEEEIDGTSAQITVRTDAGKVKVSMDTVATSDRGYFPQKGEKHENFTGLHRQTQQTQLQRNVQ